MADKILWFIDEDDDERDTYFRELSTFFSDSVTIEAIAPYSTLEEAIKILSDERTIGIIVDQRLKERGEANYTGIELATYFRAINKKLPIYILTNWAENVDEFAGAEWNVEGIIPKSIFNGDEAIRMIVGSRLLRHLNVYVDILSERSERFHELLKKTLDSDLTLEETKELNTLRFERAAPILEIENRKASEIKNSIEVNQQLLTLLSKLTPNDE